MPVAQGTLLAVDAATMLGPTPCTQSQAIYPLAVEPSPTDLPKRRPFAAQACFVHSDAAPEELRRVGTSTCHRIRLMEEAVLGRRTSSQFGVRCSTSSASRRRRGSLGSCAKRAREVRRWQVPVCPAVFPIAVARLAPRLEAAASSQEIGRSRAYRGAMAAAHSTTGTRTVPSDDLRSYDGLLRLRRTGAGCMTIAPMASHASAYYAELASALLLRIVYDMWHLVDDEASYIGGRIAPPLLYWLFDTELYTHARIVCLVLLTHRKHVWWFLEWNMDTIGDAP
ncbi:hypothetical protein BD309DRAFT_382722 [Dichomitus squalens]|nr:hypothetical protein BD309DRAFT_382722 [Dichomitus squalens]